MPGKRIEIIKGSVADDIELESLSMEAWQNGIQLLRTGRYSGEWKVTITDAIQIEWDEFRSIYQAFESFIATENDAISKD